MIRIGIFDSGMGGLSVLKQIDQDYENIHFIYYGDLANSPYGQKSREDVTGFSVQAVSFLAAKNVDAVIIACNTATSASIEEIRARFSFPVIGMEPAIKLAAEKHPGEMIAVLATSLTLKEDKYLHLREKLNLEEHVLPVPCDGLASLIDKPDLDSARDFLSDKMRNVRETGIAVLGCTHYVFLKDYIRGMNYTVYDGNEGTARRAASLLGLSRGSGKNTIELYFNSNDEKCHETAKGYLQ